MNIKIVTKNKREDFLFSLSSVITNMNGDINKLVELCSKFKDSNYVFIYNEFSIYFEKELIAVIKS